MQKERILVTVKTYPILSTKYGETVCTAGIREDGTWVRIYPVPFRRLQDEQQYRKFDWIECQLRPSSQDHRPDSFNPVDRQGLKPVGHIGTSDDWSARRQLLLETARVYNDLDELIAGAKANKLSMAVFKPSKVIDFSWKEEERDWNSKQLQTMRNLSNQPDLFEEDSWRETFRIIPKLPYSFSYHFEDVTGKQSKLQVLDWETGQLYWNCLKSTGGDEPSALEKVRNKYFDKFRKKDLHFFLGTTLQFHSIAPNPFVIIGVFPIPYELQKRLI